MTRSPALTPQSRSGMRWSAWLGVRWLLLPLLLVAFLAPRQECESRPIIPYQAPPGQPAPDDVFVENGKQLLLPPIRLGHPIAPLGTDRIGRDSRCLLSQGLGRSLSLALGVLLAGLVPGVLLGLWLGWRGRTFTVPNEVFALLLLVLLLGSGGFRVVLVIGVALLTARLVAAHVESVTREPFVEGAIALGGAPRHILRRHILPYLVPLLPALITTVLSAVFLWLMELGALGFYDQGLVQIAFSDSLDRTRDQGAFPVRADLGQLVSAGRWSWLSTPEQLALPALLLALLVISLKDLSRTLLRKHTRD